MRYFHLYTAACVLAFVLAAPANAQKLPIKTLAKKTAASAQKSAKSVSNAAIARKWRTDALKEARQVDKAFKYVFFKSGQAQTAQLVDLAAFRVYTEDQGVVSTLTNLWSSLLQGLHVMYFGPSSQVTPLTLRKQLLQNEARLKHALKNWQELKPLILRTASAADYALLSQAHAPTRFFFEESSNLDVFSKDLASLSAGRQDAIHIMTAGQPEIEKLYRQMLAFAHNKGAFPFQTTQVYQLLALKEYSNEELALLQKNLNSLECDILRSWGWKDRAIRSVIAQYRSEQWFAPYHAKDFFPTLMEQHGLISSWNKYWQQAAKTDLEKSRQIQRQLSGTAR